MPGSVALCRVENILVRAWFAIFFTSKIRIWMEIIWQIHGYLPNFNGTKVSFHTVQYKALNTMGDILAY